MDDQPVIGSAAVYHNPVDTPADAQNMSKSSFIRNSIILLLVMTFGTLAGCGLTAEQQMQRDWQQALRADTITGYDTFNAKYPNTKLADQSEVNRKKLVKVNENHLRQKENVKRNWSKLTKEMTFEEVDALVGPLDDLRGWIQQTRLLKSFAGSGKTVSADLPYENSIYLLRFDGDGKLKEWKLKSADLTSPSGS